LLLERRVNDEAGRGQAFRRPQVTREVEAAKAR
jgi:hypothetical protein